MRRWRLTVTLVSPFLTRGEDESGFPVDVALPRTADGRLLLPGTLVRGVLRDTLLSMQRRTGGALPGVPDAEKTVASLFGRPSGFDSRPLHTIAEAADLQHGAEPERGLLKIDDLVGPERKEEDAGGRYPRIEIDETFGAAREGALLVAEMPFGIGREVAFSGAIRLRAGIDPGIAERVLKLAFSAITGIGGAKSSGFGRVKGLALEDATAGADARRTEACPVATSGRYRLWLEFDEPFIVASERIAGNLFRGSAVIPGGAVKGALFDAATELDEGERALLSKTVFNHFVPARRPAAPRLLPLPFSVAVYKIGGAPVIRDTLLDDGVALWQPNADDVLAPVLEVDWKDEDTKKVTEWWGHRLAQPRTRLRVRTAIDYKTGAAAYDETGGQLFAQTLVEPVDDDGEPLHWTAEVVAPAGCEGPLAALLARLSAVDASLGKTKAPFRVIEVAPADGAIDVSPLEVTATSERRYALMLCTDAILLRLEQLRAAAGDPASAYEACLASALGKQSSLQLVRFFARHRYAGGYQAMRWRAEHGLSLNRICKPLAVEFQSAGARNMASASPFRSSLSSLGLRGTISTHLLPGRALSRFRGRVSGNGGRAVGSLLPPGNPSGHLYDRVAAPATLRAAWAKVHANGGAAGGDGVSVERFALVAESLIERLSRDLRSGTYRPGPARRVLVPKKSGGVRPLDIPCVGDRVVQGAATLVLDPVLDPHMEDASFAYRKGRSVARAVARVAALRRQGFTHVVDGDIRSYFERIPHDRLMEKLERHVDDAALVDLVWLWLETYSLTGRGVPQGAPISPLLANLYLDSVDEAIETRGVRLVRFADDFILLTKTPTSAEKALAEMRTLLAAESLELHPEKTRLVSFEEGFRFLGHVFVRSLVVQEVHEDDVPSEDAIAAAESFLREQEANARARPGDEAEAPPDGRRRADPVFPVYVVEPGRTLEARGARLRLVDEIGRVVDLPPGRIDRIELGPGSHATLDALDLAAANVVEVLRVNGRGEVVGRYEAEGPERARRHLAQARLVLDPERRARLAQAIVDARVRNHRALLRRLNRKRADPEVTAACVALNRVLRRLVAAVPLETAMGIEGQAGAVFWPAYGRCFPEPFRFSRRTRRPAKDAANLAVNAVCHMLARDLRSVALKAGLHPGFGALHETADGEDALVHDLIEEFRGPVAEACVAALFNRKALDAESFIVEAVGLRLTREGWAALIRGYEAWVARPVRSPRSGRELLWRALMLEQAYAYAEHCETGAPYRPYVMDY